MLIPSHPLGSLPFSVSLLGLGTVKFGRNQGVKYPSAFELPSDEAIDRLLGTAREIGINLLDTAPAYGLSEERLGQRLRGQRSEWIICTKTGEEFSNGESRFDFSASHTRASVERSLRRLQTDYLDLVLIHSDGNDLAILEQTEVVATLEQLRQEGKIRGFGFSGKTVEGGLAALAVCDVAMVTYNLQEVREGAVIDYAHQHQRGILIKKALGSGHLAAGVGTGDPVQASFRHILRRPGVGSIIVGTLNPAHLRANAAALMSARGDLNQP